ncbi:hypothetical protein KCU65_g6118, partial [Aureobasidium melanogenum]
MTSELSTIRSDGIYHGLPVFPEHLEGLTAIVTGANGISGSYMLRVLCKNPKRWKKIYALSRSPPYLELPSHVEHVSMDLLSEPDDIARQLKVLSIKADYVFFFAYLQPKPKEGGALWSAADELVKVNKALLANFLEGLAQASAIPKRILLQQGAKYYGMHLGPVSIPSEETDARVTLEPNFYYNQEDYLTEFCAKHGCGWNITRPSFIPGAVPNAAMNLAYPLAVYAIVQKHLGKPLVFPGDLECWDTVHVMSSAMMNCYLAEWAVLTESAENQHFNATDDSPFTWGKFWPKYAAHFDIPWEGLDTSSDARFHEVSSASNPRGWGPPGVVRIKFTLTEWAKQPEVIAAWKEIASDAKLNRDDLGDVDRIFGFTDAAILNSWGTLYSNTKLRKYGFYGFVDSTESLFNVFDEFVELKMRWERGTHFISTDPSLLDLNAINDVFDTEWMYWTTRLPLAELGQAITSSACFGLYEDGTSTQIGFARVVTDKVTFGYITDVYVLPEYRGTGLGGWLLDCVDEYVEGLPYLRWAMLRTSQETSRKAYEKRLNMIVLENKEDGPWMMGKKGQANRA